MEPSLAREAVGTVQVTGVRDVQAQRLHDAACPRLQFARHRRERILREQLPRLRKFRDLIVNLAQLLMGRIRVLRLHRRDQRLALRSRVLRDHIVSQVVNLMDRARRDIHDNVVTGHLILVYHKFLLYMKNRPEGRFHLSLFSYLLLFSHF